MVHADGITTFAHFKKAIKFNSLKHQHFGNQYINQSRFNLHIFWMNFADSWLMRHQWGCTRTWSTKGYRTRRTRPWGCTARYGTLMIGPLRVGGSRPTGLMDPSQPPTGDSRSTAASAPNRRLRLITWSDAPAPGIGGTSRWCRSWAYTRATSSFGSGPITWFTTTAPIPPDFRLLRSSASTTSTRWFLIWATFVEKLCFRESSHFDMSSMFHDMHIFASLFLSPHL